MEYVFKSVIIPIAIATITYVLFKSLDEWKKRRNQSILGMAIIDTLIEEVLKGINIMNTSNKSINKSGVLLPHKSWSGMSTIPDEVLLRIIAVSMNVAPVSFAPYQIKIHCKNYFNHMTVTWEDRMANNLLTNSAIKHLINELNFLEAAENVFKMLNQCRELLAINSKKWFPK